MRSPGQQRLQIVPVTFRNAKAFVAEHHRHHKPPRGHKFSIGVEDEAGRLRGVVSVGRPVASAFDNGRRCEVNRTCTDGCPNANSALYGAAWRTAKAMGYRTAITYTEEGESGASLRAVGWVLVAVRDPRGNWQQSTRDDRLRAMRDGDVRSGVRRCLWRIGEPLPEEAVQWASEILAAAA